MTPRSERFRGASRSYAVASTLCFLLSISTGCLSYVCRETEFVVPGVISLLATFLLFIGGVSLWLASREAAEAADREDYWAEKSRRDKFQRITRL